MRSTGAWTVAAGMAVALVGCATARDSQPKLVWQRADGSPASRAELSAAKDACVASTKPDTAAAHPQGERHAYAAQVVACVESKGYRLVEEPTP